MNSSNIPSQDKNSLAAAYAWEQYRVYANISGKIKKKLTNWRLWVLILGISSAVLGVLCQEITTHLNPEGLNNWNWLPKLLGGLSALSLGLATYFGKELVSPEQERQWIRSRSIAEAFKTQVYLFLTNTKPYNTNDKAKRLLEETENLLESAKDIPRENLSDEEKRKGLPFDILTTNDYIEKRVDEQINRFYRPTAEKYTKKMEISRNIGLILGVIGVALGTLGSTGWTAGWVAVVSTIMTSIAVYAYAGRYQYLIVSYQAVANRLELLRTRWQTSEITDSDIEQRNQFILDCEEAISIENSAWMAELTKKREQ